MGSAALDVGAGIIAAGITGLTMDRYMTAGDPLAPEKNRRAKTIGNVMTLIGVPAVAGGFIAASAGHAKGQPLMASIGAATLGAGTGLVGGPWVTTAARDW